MYKVETLSKVSLRYIDHVKKKPHDSKWENPTFEALSQNGACAKWSKFFTFKYRYIIYHFLAFFMLNNFLYYTKFYKCRNNMLFNKQMPNIANNNTNFQPFLTSFYEPFHEKMKTLHFIQKARCFREDIVFHLFLIFFRYA